MLVNQWTNAIKQVREARTALRELLSAVPTSLHEIQSWYNHPPSTSDDDDGGESGSITPAKLAFHKFTDIAC